MSHNAGTGYLNPAATGLAAPYAKNQIGNVYQQLQDGARALDIRPKLLRNGTVILQHGSTIDIPVSFETVLTDAIRWCREHPDELVLWLPSHFATQDDYDGDMVAVLSSLYQQYNVPYVHCSQVYGMTVGEVLQLAALPASSSGGGGGYLLAMDGQDDAGTSCAKQNWVASQIVTCYPNNATTTSCISSTRRRHPRSSSTTAFDLLHHYINQSANGAVTNDNSVLGPPADLQTWPLNEVQALWQVDAHAVTLGMTHVSSILQDNRRSNLHAQLVEWIYNDNLFEPARLAGTSILLAVDNVHLHGNALLSVLRTSCGQTDDTEACGRRVPPPRRTNFPVTLEQVGGIIVAVYAVVSLTHILWYRRRVWTTFLSRLQEIVMTETTECCASRAAVSSDGIWRVDQLNQQDEETTLQERRRRLLLVPTSSVATVSMPPE